MRIWVAHAFGGHRHAATGGWGEQWSCADNCVPKHARVMEFGDEGEGTVVRRSAATKKPDSLASPSASPRLRVKPAFLSPSLRPASPGSICLSDVLGYGGALQKDSLLPQVLRQLKPSGRCCCCSSPCRPCKANRFPVGSIPSPGSPDDIQQP